MKLREHRGSLAESMETLVELENRDALVRYYQERHALDGLEFGPADIKVELYIDRLDARTGWEKTYIVIIEGYGVVGFTDALC